MKNNIIILGGGQAGIYAAREIRQNDSESNIKILGEESEASIIAKNIVNQRSKKKIICILVVLIF